MPEASIPSENLRDYTLLDNQISSITEEILNEIQSGARSKKDELQQVIHDKTDVASDTEGVDKAIDLTVEVHWDDTDILIPYVEYRVDWKKTSVDLLQAKITDKEFIFYTPSIRVVDKKTGQYPEFVYCGLTCTIEWRDIIAKVPELFMEEHRIVIGVPELCMDTIMIQVPQLTVNFSQKKTVLGLPQFGLGNLKVVSKGIDENPTQASEDDKQAFKKLTEPNQSIAKAKASSKVHALFECHRGNIKIQKDLTIASIDAQIMATKVNLDMATSKGITDAVGQIQSTLDQLSTQRKTIATQFDNMVSELSAREKELIRQVVDKVDAVSAT